MEKNMKKIAILMILAMGANLLAIKPGMITLVSSDGHEIEVNKNTAQLSNTLKHMMEENEELIEFPVPNIEGKTLEKVFEVAQAQRLLSDDMKGKALLDTLEPMVQVLNIPNRFKLLEAANYLDYPTLFDLLARSIARNLPENWMSFSTVKDLQPAIAKQYYLIHGKNLSGVDPNSYGFSIAELLDANRLPAIKVFGTNTILDLSKQRINSIDGIHDIPHITSIQILHLNNNKLINLPETSFEGLNKLTGLHLEENNLESLPNGIFNSLTSLKSLFLSFNLLTSLPNGIFNTLTNLEDLYLDNNSLTSLPNGIFNPLINLKSLYLNDNILVNENELESLPNGIFNTLINLKFLYLNKNTLKSLPKGIFNALRNLESLYLGYNELSSLPDGIFNTLINLNNLELNNNNLSSLSNGIFNTLTNLITLGLNNNHLESLADGIFKTLTKLKFLNLKNNPLSNSTKEKINNAFKKKQRVKIFLY